MQCWHQVVQRANFHSAHPSAGVVGETVRLEKLIWEEGGRCKIWCCCRKEVEHASSSGAGSPGCY